MRTRIFWQKNPLGHLLLKLALPTVAAQIINMLYNIVDRIYIGHIPGDGALALTGVGVCMPLIMIVSAFAALVGNGGAPRASIFMGQGDKAAAEQTLGNCFTVQIIISVILTISAAAMETVSFLLAFGASENTVAIRCGLYEHLCPGNHFCTADSGHERFYHCPGICQNRHACPLLVGAASQHYTGSRFYFRIWHMGVRGAALATIISQATFLRHGC